MKGRQVTRLVHMDLTHDGERLEAEKDVALWRYKAQDSIVYVVWCSDPEAHF